MKTYPAADAAAARFNQELGCRLRAARAQNGMSLQAVETESRGRLKAVLVGSYERADRSVSAARLAELVEFYGTTVTEVWPHGEPPSRQAAAAFVAAIPDLISELPPQHLDRIASKVVASLRQRLEADIAGRYQRRIAQLERQVAELRADLPVEVTL